MLNVAHEQFINSEIFYQLVNRVLTMVLIILTEIKTSRYNSSDLPTPLNDKCSKIRTLAININNFYGASTSTLQQRKVHGEFLSILLSIYVSVEPNHHYSKSERGSSSESGASASKECKSNFSRFFPESENSSIFPPTVMEPNGQREEPLAMFSAM